MRAAAEVADEVERRHGGSPARPMSCRAPVERDVVDVVAGRLRQRPVLAPAGHPAVDEPRVAGEAPVGAEAEPLGHPGRKPSISASAPRRAAARVAAARDA